MQAEKNAPFAKKRRLRRVEVLRGLDILFENAAAERDHFADIVANRKHDPTAETIVDFTIAARFVAQFHEAALHDLPATITAIERPFQKCVPTIGRVTDLPVCRDLAIDSAFLQIISRGRADFSLQQIFVEPFRRFRVQLQQRAPSFVLTIVLNACSALFDHWNSRARRQFAHRGRKIDVLVIHHEAENASADAAAETVKRLPRRTDRERRRFFLMKRAERLEICARALERKVRADHLHDVVGGRDLLDCL